MTGCFDVVVVGAQQSLRIVPTGVLNGLLQHVERQQGRLGPRTHGGQTEGTVPQLLHEGGELRAALVLLRRDAIFDNLVHHVVKHELRFGDFGQMVAGRVGRLDVFQIGGFLFLVVVGLAGGG